MATTRSYALDALRGWAILGMALSGLLPWGTLPAWMYHAQVPPPDMKFTPEVLGITWVDLVFPFFLFAMGAALPLARAARKGRGDSPMLEYAGIAKRFALLAAFGILIQNTRPASLGELGTPFAWWFGLAMFAAICLTMIRTSIPVANIDAFLRVLGALGVAGGCWYLHSQGLLDPKKQDIIIMVLAAVSVTGALLAILFEADHRFIGVAFGVVMAWVVAALFPGPVQDLWKWNPIPVLTQPMFQKYLAIIIPGIIAGIWITTLPDRTDEDAPIASRSVLAVAFAAMAIPACLVGLHGREVVLCLAVCAGLALGSLGLMGLRDRMTGPLIVGWGLLLAGLIAEPIGGGIRKDSATPSYYLTTAGLAIFFLLLLMVWREFRGMRDRPGFMALVGMNPLLGYILITHFIFAAVRLPGIHNWVGGQGWSPWAMAGYALAQTLVIGAIAALASWRKVVVRA